MLAKKTVKNQLTLPKEIVDLFPDSDSFDVQVENGRIILKPIQPDRLEQLQTYRKINQQDQHHFYNFKVAALAVFFSRGCSNRSHTTGGDFTVYCSGFVIYVNKSATKLA